MIKQIFTLLLSFAAISSMAQNIHHCGTEHVTQQLLATHPEFAQIRESIELQTADYIAKFANAKKTRATLYTIPVVVHVIHNGEGIGSGANISVAQINSQIAILNKDYRKKNTDSLATSHAYYANTSDCEIEFCLAKRDPNGNSTTGIDRFDYNKSSYDFSDIDGYIKQNTIWDRNQYLNIWVCTFGGSASSLLGYAMPPGSPSDQDGVVVGTKYFGNTGNVQAPYNKGRTATHEIGHYLNLRHIWGDASCGTDLVSDTKPAEEANYGCPSFPHNANSACGAGVSGEMYMNYMDYVDDGCMKMFTTGQKNRMRAVLASSGSRNSLTTSPGCQWPNAIHEITKESIFSIFPNPVSTHFYLKSEKDFSADIKIKILNSLGQVIIDGNHGINKEAPNRYYVDLQSLAAGTYFVHVMDAQNSFTKTISVIK
ncbi:MAG: T9SS type A sorting domain-containing protein [Bacteroidetes bacterium]|nr:T9SS type A sorting domain-containing protein [Bacteroidota bacterium]